LLVLHDLGVLVDSRHLGGDFFELFLFRLQVPDLDLLRAGCYAHGKQRHENLPVTSKGVHAIACPAEKA
jgi:hypothetical protein